VTVAAGAAALVGLSALPALAHVTVSSPGATRGGFGVITFRVPTESATASTTGLKVQFPAGQPLPFTSIKPKAGWTYRVTKATLPTPVKTDDGEVTEYTSVIEWKASSPAAGIKPGEFDEFQVSAGPLPEAESMTFKAIQTYSDGKAVSWIEEPAPGSSEEPQYPSPTLKLAAAGSDRTGAATAATAATAAGTAEGGGTGSDAASKGAVSGAYVLGGLGLLAGLAGLAAAATARRRAAPPTPTGQR
jgi:uncharacterized protein